MKNMKENINIKKSHYSSRITKSGGSKMANKRGISSDVYIGNIEKTARHVDNEIMNVNSLITQVAKGRPLTSSNNNYLAINQGGNVK